MQYATVAFRYRVYVSGFAELTVGRGRRVRLSPIPTGLPRDRRGRSQQLWHPCWPYLVATLPHAAWLSAQPFLHTARPFSYAGVPAKKKWGLAFQRWWWGVYSIFMNGRSGMAIAIRPSHPCNTGTDHVGLSPTRQALLAPSAKRREVLGESHQR